MESGDSPNARLSKLLTVVRSARGFAEQKWSTKNRKRPRCLGRLSLTPPFLGAFAKLWKVALSFVMSFLLPVLPHAKKTSVPTGRLFIKSDTWFFFSSKIVGNIRLLSITRRMSFACWILKATKTHSEYVIIPAFSTAVVVMWTCLGVTLYVGYLACRVNFDFQRRWRRRTNALVG